MNQNTASAWTGTETTKTSHIFRTGMVRKSARASIHMSAETETAR